MDAYSTSVPPNSTKRKRLHSRTSPTRPAPYLSSTPPQAYHGRLQTPRHSEVVTVCLELSSSLGVIIRHNVYAATGVQVARLFTAVTFSKVHQYQSYQSYQVSEMCFSRVLLLLICFRCLLRRHRRTRQQQSEIDESHQICDKDVHFASSFADRYTIFLHLIPESVGG